MLNIPPWIEKAGLINSTRKYKWDDPWECGLEVPRLQNKIGVLWSRAILALAAGFAEWIVWRFHKSAPDPVFQQFLEATWAAVVDRRYLNHVSAEFEVRIRRSYSLPRNPQRLSALWNSDDDFSDPMRGPPCIALLILADVADRTAPRDFGSMEAVYLSNLVEQVVGKGEPFKSWRQQAIVRLTKLYGSDAEEESWLGPPVPRESLNPDAKFQTAMTASLIDGFLSKLNPSENPFLVPAKEMIKLGFEGTPYRFS